MTNNAWAQCPHGAGRELLHESKRLPNLPGRVWRDMFYDMTRGADIARYIARHRYVWPGGYPLFAIADDGAPLCANCCRTEYRLIRNAIPRDGWHIVGYTYADDINEPEFCAHCNENIHDM